MTAEFPPESGSPARHPLDELDVIFLVWRESPAMLERHHAAVAEALPDSWHGGAVLVENAAPWGTAQAARRLVADSYPAARKAALRLPRNMGFAAAMNLALAECSGRYVALLNSDGRPEPDMLLGLLDALEDDERAIWAAPGVHGPGEPGHPRGAPFEEEELPGMALVMRREDFLALGAFDPLFFFYNEDYDASRRLRAAGHRLLRVPEVRFQHGKGGRSRRGQALREFWFAVTWSTFLHRHEGSAPHVVRRVLRGRRRSIAAHALQGRWPAVLALTAATLAWPASLVLAEHRRRRPWTAERLDRWSRRRAAGIERVELGGVGKPESTVSTRPARVVAPDGPRASHSSA